MQNYPFNQNYAPKNWHRISGRWRSYGVKGKQLKEQSCSRREAIVRAAGQQQQKWHGQAAATVRNWAIASVVVLLEQGLKRAVEEPEMKTIVKLIVAAAYRCRILKPDSTWDRVKAEDRYRHRNSSDRSQQEINVAGAPVVEVEAGHRSQPPASKSESMIEDGVDIEDWSRGWGRSPEAERHRCRPDWIRSQRRVSKIEVGFEGERRGLHRDREFRARSVNTFGFIYSE